MDGRWKVEVGGLFLTLKSRYTRGGGWESRWETRRFGCRKRDPRKVVFWSSKFPATDH